MPAFVSVDVIPQVARPDAINATLAEAVQLRDRYRRSQEELAGLEAELQRLEHDDVVAAAERIRAGSPAGNVLAAVTKTRSAVELSRRNNAAIGVASDASQDDLVNALTAHAPKWLDALDREAGRARQRAAKALDEFEAALGDLAEASSASIWVASAQSDARWDHPVRMASAGTVAPSSRKATANSEALDRATLVGYCRELIEPPAAPAPQPVVHVAESAA